jgi:hypothetical protein
MRLFYLYNYVLILSSSLSQASLRDSLLPFLFFDLVDLSALRAYSLTSTALEYYVLGA